MISRSQSYKSMHEERSQYFVLLSMIVMLLRSTVWCFAFEITHIHRQVGVSGHLANRLNFSDMIPIVVDDALHGRTDCLTYGFAFPQQVRLHSRTRYGFQEGLDLPLHGMP